MRAKGEPWWRGGRDVMLCDLDSAVCGVGSIRTGNGNGTARRPGRMLVVPGLVLQQQIPAVMNNIYRPIGSMDSDKSHDL